MPHPHTQLSQASFTPAASHSDHIHTTDAKHSYKRSKLNYSCRYSYDSKLVREQILFFNMKKLLRSRLSMELGYQQLIDYQHSSKYLLLSSTEEERHTCLEQHKDLNTHNHFSITFGCLGPTDNEGRVTRS